MSCFRNSVLLFIVILIAVVFVNEFGNAAGSTGILTGRVTDVSGGDALPGVNILVVGSGRGAVTNVKGQYSITGITPGQYIIRASLLGYKTVETKKIEIEADQTSVFDFKLASTEIEMEGVTVQGERPLVDVRKTAGDQTFNRDKIDQLPNLKGVEDVLALQAGVVKFGNQLFLRGGRANETQILIDGVPVNSVGGTGASTGTSTANEQLQQLYSGTGGGGGGALSVAANAIQSVSVSSSGLDAEYGNAQSGVVSITTKSGSESFSGAAQYRTDGLGNSGFGERYYAANIGGPEPLTTYLLPSLGVDVPGKASIFMSADFNQNNGPYSFSTSQFYNPLKRKIKFGGLFGSLLSGLGFTYSDKQSNAFSFNMKVSYGVGDNDQFAYSYRANVSSSHSLGGNYSWRDKYDSTLSHLSLSTQNVFQWTHILGRNALLKGFISRLETESNSTVGDLTPAQYSTITNSGDRDLNEDGFNDLGTGQSWGSGNTVVWNAKFDYSAQVHELHYLKTGIDYFYEDIQSTSISFPTAPIDERLPDSLGGGRGQYPGYGSGRWITSAMPSRGALYVQDNIELTGLNIHVGLRYDFFFLGNQVFDQGPLGFVTRWEAITGEKATWLDHKSFFSQFARGSFSPRLSIGYPVSENTVFYFNYGHFLQYPDRDQFFHDPIYTTLGGNYVGNPSLRPQKTIQYEAGFDQLIFVDLSLGIRGFYKDIFDYVAPRTLPVPQPLSKYVNLDYASTRGFEVILTKGLSSHYSGSLGYTFQLAKGRSSNPFAALNSPQLQGLPRETRLDYDQQHTLNVFLGYKVSPSEEFDVFGINISNWGASVTWSYGSGFPYTPYNRQRSIEDLYLLNTGNGPYTSEINVAVYKGFRFLDKLNLTLTMDITNLLDRRNVDLNAGGFNSLTGRPFVFGDYNPDTKVIYSWDGVAGGNSFDSRVPPFIFRAPRQISFGMKLNWD